MKVMISGLVNIETTLRVRKFPIDYYPIDYPFFGIASDVSGVAYNVAKALLALGDEIGLASFVGEDEEGKRILARLEAEGIGTGLLRRNLRQTPVTVALYDDQGRRQIYCAGLRRPEDSAQWRSERLRGGGGPGGVLQGDESLGRLFRLFRFKLEYGHNLDTFSL